jgi:acetyltransferase-like isoleucine patch superfamily enzyme
MTFISKFKTVRRRGSLISLPYEMVKSGGRWAARKLRLSWYKYIYGLQMNGTIFIGPRLNLVLSQNITIRDGAILTGWLRCWSEFDDGKLIIGKNVSIARNVLLDFSGTLTIQKDALISEEVLIYTHDHGRDPRSAPRAASLTIGKNAWIGARSIIMPSVGFIGKDAIVAAGSTVTKDIPDNHIFIGQRNKLIKRDDETANVRQQTANGRWQT